MGWYETRANLGYTLTRLAVRDRDGAALSRAVHLLREASDRLADLDEPRRQVLALVNLGDAVTTLGFWLGLEHLLNEGIAFLRIAENALKPSFPSAEATRCLWLLGGALVRAGSMRHDPSLLEEALRLMQQGVSEDPLALIAASEAHLRLGQAYGALFEIRNEPHDCERALEHLEHVLAPDATDSTSKFRAEALMEIGLCLQRRGLLSRSSQTLHAGIARFQAALAQTTLDEDRSKWLDLKAYLGFSLSWLGQVNKDPSYFKQAIRPLQEVAAIVNEPTTPFHAQVWEALGWNLYLVSVAECSLTRAREARQHLLVALKATTDPDRRRSLVSKIRSSNAVVCRMRS